MIINKDVSIALSDYPILNEIFGGVIIPNPIFKSSIGYLKF